MTGYGRFIFFTNSGNLLSSRSYLLNFHQNASKTGLKALKASIFPSKPKRPEPIFFLFLKRVRPKYFEENPNIKSIEIVKKASEEWAKLNPSEKQTFQEEYNENYQLYTEKLREYNNSISDEQKQHWDEVKKEYEIKDSQENVKRKAELFGKPKKPANAFFHYLQAKKSERDAGQSLQEWVKSTTSSWHELSQAEKEPFYTQSTQHMTEYTKNLEEWETKMINLGHSDLVRHKTLMKYKQTNE